MNVNIKEEIVNRPLHRTELFCELEFDAETPSRKQIIKSVAAKKGINESLVVVDRIDQPFGKKAASAFVKVYESEKALKLVEPAYKMERDQKSETKKAAAKPAPAEEAKPAEEKKENAPVEEKREDAPAEEKKEEAPAEKPKEEAPAEEKPAEDAPAEEKKE